MNNKRRAQLNMATKMLGECLSIVSNATNQEQYCLDNIPENLQDSDSYEKMQDAISELDDACSCIEDAMECISNASV